MELVALIGQPYAKLLDDLAKTVEELCAVVDELAYTRAAELTAAAQAWNGTADDSIQKKDRAAKYASSGITMEVYKLEATRDMLTERKYFTIRLLDDLRKA